CLGGITGLDYW
nr:immunoglobulin heavy chain junction region [Macaca mulatta]MOW47857.1 immunoglobulin heavy chain junction region [Macaca mulatta]